MYPVGLGDTFGRHGAGHIREGWGPPVSWGRWKLVSWWPPLVLARTLAATACQGLPTLGAWALPMSCRWLSGALTPIFWPSQRWWGIISPSFAADWLAAVVARFSFPAFHRPFSFGVS
jgi:hypothetical protein